MTAEALTGLLSAAPRANIAFRRGDAVQATPVAFLYRKGRYWIGLPRGDTEPMANHGTVVELVVDDGRWFFDLRGVRARGRIARADRPPAGGSPALAWFEVVPEKVVAWDYGTLHDA